MRGNPFLNQAVEEHPPCMGCGKECFPSERPLMALGGSWHPGCLKCTQCGITLSPRMMESYNKQPYCRAHRPDPKATQVHNDFHKVQATTVVKAPRRQPGVDVTARQTFYAGPGQLDQLQKNLHDQKTQINPTGYIPDKPAAPNRTRAQGVNKLEGTTFNDSSMTNQRGAAPMHSEPQSWDGGAVQQEQSYDSGSHDQGGYDQGGHDQGGYDQGGYDQGGHDQGGYDQGGDQGGYDQGGYDQGGDQGGYDQGGDQGGYDQGSYDQGGYDENQGYDQGYDQNQESTY